SLPLKTGTTTLTYGPTWQKYRLNFGGSYLAPFDITLAASYTVEAGPWSGPIVYKLDTPNPVFGPSTVISSTGVKESNPLSTVLRYTYPTRGDGQVLAPAVRTLGFKVGRKLRFGRVHEAEIAANIFNVTNAGNYTQYNYSGASESFNP